MPHHTPHSVEFALISNYGVQPKVRVELILPNGYHELILTRRFGVSLNPSLRGPWDRSHELAR